MSKLQALRGRVTGRVQGVFFRAATQSQARQLGLGGWVRNSADGAVEFALIGDSQALASMRDWLATGPPQARVDQLLIDPCSVAHAGDPAQFEILR